MSVPLIILPGALGALEGSDAVARLLGDTRSVVTIDYTPEDTFDDLLRRVIEAADLAGANSFDLLGQSYGGWIAQCVARQFPKRVRRLVLSHSFALEEHDAWRFRVGKWLMPRLRRSLASWLILKRAGTALTPVRAKNPDLYASMLEALLMRAKSNEFFQTLEAQQQCMWESLQPPTIRLPRLGEGSAVLIIESDNDPLIRKADRAALRKLIPHAAVHHFSNAGHVSAIAESGAYAAAVEAFLARD